MARCKSLSTYDGNRASDEVKLIPQQDGNAQLVHLQGPLGSGWYVNALAGRDDTIFVCAGLNGTYRSTDNGSMFTDVNSDKHMVIGLPR
jgi:hypothetical protein